MIMVPAPESVNLVLFRLPLVSATRREDEMIDVAVVRSLVALVLLTTLVNRARAADLVALSPQTSDRYIPSGKEVDAIYGDFALVNDQIMSVVAHPRAGRNANMTVREVGGCVIDLTRRDRQSDQLSAF